MKIILAYATKIDGKDCPPDAEVEVDDALGRQLVNEGFARMPPSDDLTVTELRELADQLGVPLGGFVRKADILRELEPHLPRVRTAATVQDGVGVATPNAPTVAELRAFAKARGVDTATAKGLWRDEHAGPHTSPVATPDAGTEPTGDTDGR